MRRGRHTGKTQHQIDIIEYLDDRGIDYSTSGKNVSEGWIGLQCPCCEDRSNHLGINLTSNIFNCFICGTKGGPAQLVMALENVHYSQAQEILQKYSSATLTTQEKFISSKHVELPFGLSKELQPQHKAYLESRNFSAETYEKYKLQCFGPVGDYKFRIFIPFFRKNKLVTFTSRDITDKQRKYKACPNEQSILTPHQTLYNIDSVRDVAIVVEGVTDVWRIGEGAVALNGLQCSSAQLKLLANFSRVYIMLDNTAQDQATEIGENLSMFTDVHILALKEGDPADLPESEVKKLRLKIF